MGPITLFDKSFLQSLSLDESVWFDNFFYSVICPLFYVETLADLEKDVKQGRTPEQLVGHIADKSPDFHRNLCGYHRTLCVGNMMGHPVPMTGQIPIIGGHAVESNEGKKGVVFEPSDESKALSRWQDRNFLELERKFAFAWRRSLENLDLLAAASSIRAMGINDKNCKSLDKAKEIAQGVIHSGQPTDIVKLASIFFGIAAEHEKLILDVWRKAGNTPLPIYAPYTAYVLTVEIFFRIALGSSLISTQRPSNRTDIAYLFYLPFCMIFVSSDKLHRNCAALFLRKDQEFVWDEDLKADLKRLNDHYSELPDEEKEKGITRFASYPPKEGDYLTSSLWDRHLPNWRNINWGPPNMSPEAEKKLVEQITRQAESRSLDPHKVDETNTDFMMIKHKVRKRKGSWWQLPKDLKASDEKEDHNAMTKEVRQLANVIAESLPEKIQISALTLHSKIPFKVLSLRELIIHRVSFLTISAINLFESNQIIPAIIITRAIIETVSIIYNLHERLTQFLNDENKLELDNFLMTCLFGRKDDPRFPQPIDTLSFIDNVSKKIPEFRKFYDMLHEYSSPSYPGLFGSFGNIDREKFELQLGPKDMNHALTLGISSLSSTLMIFNYYYNDSAELINKLNDHFEASGEKELLSE